MKIRFNLLPGKQKKHLQTQKAFRIVEEQQIYLIVVLLFLGLSLFAMYFILKVETSIMQDVANAVTKQEQYKEISAIHDKFTTVHKQMNATEKLVNNHTEWSELLITLSENIPQNIIINSVKTNGAVITIKALADTRGDVIFMKETFRDIKRNDIACFSEIVVPESELTVPVDVLFTMTFKVNLECLK